MKTLLSISQKLIQFNLFAAFVAVLVFVAIREQQAIMTDSQQKLLANSKGYHQSMKQTNQPQQDITSELEATKLQQYEQKLQKLTKQLENYQIKSVQKTKPSPTVATIPFRTNQSLIPSVTSLVANPNPYRVILKESYFPRIDQNPTPKALANPTASHQKVSQSSQPLVKTIDITNSGDYPRIFSPGEVVWDYPSLFFSWLNQNNSNVSQLPSPSDTPQNPEIIIPPSAPPEEIALEPIKSDEEFLSTEAERELVAMGPLPPQTKRTEKSNKSGVHQDVAIRYANDIAYGLIIADEKGEINYGTRNYKKVQTAINRLRRGETLEEAARLSQISSEVLVQLGKWGVNRPGRDELTQISQSTEEYK
jgi:hypothetical protein